MRLHVGCAMWTHASWPGRHLPQPLAPHERLHAYAGLCDAVEGNTTFYATPSAESVDSWAEQTTPDFRFVLKLPKAITHERRLAGVDDEVRAFVSAIEPLGPRVHALWIQLPPSFDPTGLRPLAAFLRRLPREHRYAVEVRHRAFFVDPRWTERLEDALGETGAEWVMFDTTAFFASEPRTDAERESWERKPRLPRRSRALTRFPVVRYLGRDDARATVAGWRPWLDTVVDWLREGRSPTFFVHTPDNVDAPALARRFHAEVRARLPELAPLPEPRPAGQGTLF
jgi:uncharacterized protein YecE (DUF72 family)